METKVMKESIVDKPMWRATFSLLLVLIWTQMSAAQTVGGRVVDEKGDAISGVKVKVSWFDSPSHGTERECTTDAQGRWQVALPADVDDVINVYLAHHDYISDKSSRKNKPPMSRLRDGTSIMVMKKGLKVKGIVRSHDGKPIEDALILPHGYYATTAPGAAIEDSTTARTAADGSFALTSLEPGPRELTVTAIGFGPESVPVDVVVNMTAVKIVMRPGGTFQGRVLDEDGKPVEGAGVYTRIWEMRRRHIVNLTTRTNAEGHFRITDAPREGSLEFYISKRGFLSPHYEVYFPQEEPYKITLYRPLIISGSVVDDKTDTPITDFEVSDGILWPYWSKISWRRPQVVHSKRGTFRRTIGRFVFRQSLPSCAVRIMAKGYVPGATPLIQVGEKPEPFVVRLHKGNPWTGFVNDSAGKPVLNANVAWIGPGHKAFVKNARLQPQYHASPEWIVQTNTSGRFELPPSRTEGWILVLHETGYGWWHSRRFVRNSTVRLTAWAQIEGMVHIPDANNHSTQLKIEPIEDSKQTAVVPIQWFFTETSHIDGRFSFDYVPSISLGVGHISEDKFFLGKYITPQPGQKSKVVITTERTMPISVPSLVDSALPAMEDIKIDFELEQAKGLRLLLCFFDMNQRPSRNCIMRLAKQVEQLKQKGVTVVAVQASKVDENALNKWVKNYNIPFPVGMVKGDVEKSRFTWGVKSLPWLILTDHEHIVRANGFSLAELDEKIQSTEK